MKYNENSKYLPYSKYSELVTLLYTKQESIECLNFRYIMKVTAHLFTPKFFPIFYHCVKKRHFYGIENVFDFNKNRLPK